MTYHLQISAETCALRARFFPCGDRLGHCVECVTESAVHLLLTSVEDDDESPWPASPPWQELNVHTVDGAQAALLVGRAGTSHWSLSLAAEEQKKSLVWDAACRFRQRPAWLGCTYQLHAQPVQFDAAHCRWEICGVRLMLEIGRAMELPATLQLNDEQLAIRASTAAATFPQTVQWTYGLRFA